ncbi:uncharacterized protein LOC113234708 [Hyposmocoma kahamanoa]|uniref:uncharacterized protein LOC113234708 n=1 Tax=Hyposmocoma kahamanoa TaxID=1477025 RepID=UPI000E6D8231|nr:uncharacterized protein LOC113234708 [Hyposmocoma kahamanoa]
MSVGKISEFDVHKDDWRLYIERLEQYFIVNNVKSEHQVPTLITVMGAEAYELLVNLCTPERPKTKTFQQITAILEGHLQPKPSELAERYKFRHRTQNSGETIAEYITVLKRMSKTCEFGNWLEESLRDQLVCGIISDTIRQRLFAESKLDFKRAYSLAVSMETAEKDAAIVQGHGRSPAEPMMTVPCQAIAGERWRRKGAAGDAVRGGSGAAREAGPLAARRERARTEPAPPPPQARTGRFEQRPRSCRACGGAHDSVTCKFMRYVCRVCNQIGHLRRMCPNITNYVSTGVSNISGDTDSVDSDEFQIL